MCVTAIHDHAWITVSNAHELRDEGTTLILKEKLELDQDLDLLFDRELDLG